MCILATCRIYTPMKYGTIPPMRVAHRPSVRPGILSLGSHPCFFIFLFYFLLACSIISWLNTLLPLRFFFSILLFLSLSLVFSADIVPAISPSPSLFCQWLDCSSMSQPNPNERIQVDVRYALFLFLNNSLVMPCQLKQKPRIQAIKGYKLRLSMICFRFVI